MYFTIIPVPFYNLNILLPLAPWNFSPRKGYFLKRPILNKPTFYIVIKFIVKFKIGKSSKSGGKSLKTSQKVFTI
jgi:hypothetical protein